MAFWNRKKNTSAEWKAEYSHDHIRRQDEQQRQGFARQDIEVRLAEKVIRYHYKEEALSIAQHLPQQDQTKNEVMAIAYRQIRDQLTHEKLNFEGSYYTERAKENIIPYITYEDRERNLQKHKYNLNQLIHTLEAEAQQARQTLERNHTLTQDVERRLSTIQHKQFERESKLDQQLADVQSSIKQIQNQLRRTSKQTPTKNAPDIDRLETMLEELKRLNDVG